MHVKHTVFVVACCLIIKFGFIKTLQIGLNPSKSKEYIEEDDANAIGDGHTFVALIDVVFKDGTKRTCTGTIIHDYVVVTAGHCFVHETEESIKPEVTASFVVIGTKKMYEAGYEQYLPIEKILIHPKHRSWTADLCLVYTFAGMTSDKPGKIIRIGGDKMTNPVDSNLTVYSWGTMNVDEVPDKLTEYKSPDKHQSKPTESQCDESSSEERDDGITAGVESKRARLDSMYRATNRVSWNTKHFATPRKSRHTEKFHESVLYKFPTLRESVKKGKQKLQEHPLEWQPTNQPTSTTTPKRLSRYLTSEEESEKDEGVAVIYIPPQKDNLPPIHVSSMPIELHKLEKYKFSYGYEETTRRLPKRTITRRIIRHTFNRSWRRAMGTTENILTALNYGLINTVSCKKFLENALSPQYEYMAGEVACFSTDEHCLTDDDSGAPAIRHSQLFAVIIGGIESEGDHVGVGLRMSCYCSWINDNLPGDINLDCCKNCCDVKHTEPIMNSQNFKRQRTSYY